jgi:hypothetical protein
MLHQYCKSSGRKIQVRHTTRYILLDKLTLSKSRTVYHHEPIDKITSISIDLCDNYKDRLPDQSAWVNSPLTGVLKQCVFACKHGWRKQLAEELQQRIHERVYTGGRQDLKPFLDAIENAGVIQGGGTLF